MEAKKIARWFLSKGTMSPKKIQKLVYYAYAWYLTLMNERVEELDYRLFDEEIKAWAHGPVVYSIYQEYRKHRFLQVPKVTVDESEYDEDTLDVLNQVWDVYGHYTANELESITHQEEPWINARKGLTPLQIGNESIRDEDIFSYYLSQMGTEA